MAQYKPVKILFDIDDEHQKELYEYLKQRSNSSSFVRTLLYQKMISAQQKEYEVVKEQDTNNINEFKATSSTVNVPKVSIKQPVKVSVNNSPVIRQPEDDEIILDGLL